MGLDIIIHNTFNHFINKHLKIPLISLLFFSIFFLALSQYANAALTCRIQNVAKMPCTESEIDVFHMYDNESVESHAEMPDQTNYDWHVCCSGVSGLSNECSGNYVIVLRLSDITNAHVEEGTQNNYKYTACLSSNTATITCRYVSACTERETCLGSISNDASLGYYTGTNAHVAGCGFYEHNICCTSEGIPEYSLTITVISPENGRVYPRTPIELNYTVESVDINISDSYYILDEFEPKHLLCSYSQEIRNGKVVHICEYHDIFNWLSDGTHNLYINATDEKGNTNSTRVTFFVGFKDEIRPSVKIYSPEERIYNKKNIDLNYTAIDCAKLRSAEEPQTGGTAECEIYGKVDTCWYSLIGPVKEKEGVSPNIIVILPDCENTTLKDLVDGRYTITVYANDTAGNVCLDPDSKECQSTVPEPTGYKPCCDRKNFTVSTDTTPPISHVHPLDPYQFTTKFNISWSGYDPGQKEGVVSGVTSPSSGINCYVIQYYYEKETADIQSQWTNISFPDGDCTKLTRWEFDADYAVCGGSTPQCSDGYTFYFRSKAVDNAGNWEDDHPKPDTNTTIYIPRLIEVRVIDMLGNVISSPENDNYYGAKTSASLNVTINVGSKSETALDNITIIYNVRRFGEEIRWKQTGWTQVECENALECNVTVGPYQDDMIVDYVAVAHENSDYERLPPTGNFYFFMYKHPVAEFLIKKLFINVGRSEFVPIRVRNVMSKPSIISLELSESILVFVDTGGYKWQGVLNPQEERIIYAKVLPSVQKTYEITLTATSSTPPHMLSDTDTMTIYVLFPPNFPEFQIWAIILLILIAAIIYWRISKNIF